MSLRPSTPLRLRLQGPLPTIVLSLCGIAVVIVAMVVALTAQNRLLGTSHYTVWAQFDDASNIAPHNQVRIGGYRVGQVLRTRVRAHRALAELQLDRDLKPLTSETTIRVRPRGTLGQQYLDLRPGRGGAPLPDGATIPASRTSAAVPLPDVLDAFDPRTRRALHTDLDELGRGFTGRGAGLNDANHVGAAFLRDSRLAAQAVLASEGAARRLFPSLDQNVRAAEPVREDIARGFEPAARALRPFSSPALRATLEEAPPALRAVRSGLSRTDPLVRELTLLAGDTKTLMAAAPASLRQLTALMRESVPAFKGTPGNIARLRRATRPTLALLAHLSPQLPRLRDNFRDSIPGLRELGRHRCDVLAFASNWRSMLAFGVPGGGEIGPLNALRVRVIGAGYPAGSGGATKPRLGGVNAYPAPCQAGAEKLP